MTKNPDKYEVAFVASQDKTYGIYYEKGKTDIGDAFAAALQGAQGRRHAGGDRDRSTTWIPRPWTPSSSGSHRLKWSRRDEAPVDFEPDVFLEALTSKSPDRGRPAHGRPDGRVVRRRDRHRPVGGAHARQPAAGAARDRLDLHLDLPRHPHPDPAVHRVVRAAAALPRAERGSGSRRSWPRPSPCRSTRRPTRPRSCAAACCRSTMASGWRRGRSACRPTRVFRQVIAPAADPGRRSRRWPTTSSPCSRSPAWPA